MLFGNANPWFGRTRPQPMSASPLVQQPQVQPQAVQPPSDLAYANNLAQMYAGQLANPVPGSAPLPAPTMGPTGSPAGFQTAPVYSQTPVAQPPQAPFDFRQARMDWRMARPDTGNFAAFQAWRQARPPHFGFGGGH